MFKNLVVFATLLMSGALASAEEMSSNATIDPLNLIAVCQTQSRGRFFSVRDYDYNRAQQGTYAQCTRAGGVPQECANNMRCQWQDDMRPPNPPQPPQPGSYFDWGRGRDGWGYCYEWTYDHRVLNGGQPVPNLNCERTRPSYFQWGQGRDGYTYCYQWTPYGVPMNQGRPVPNSYCQ